MNKAANTAQVLLKRRMLYNAYLTWLSVRKKKNEKCGIANERFPLFCCIVVELHKYTEFYLTNTVRSAFED